MLLKNVLNIDHRTFLALEVLWYNSHHFFHFTQYTSFHGAAATYHATPFPPSPPTPPPYVPLEEMLWCVLWISCCEVITDAALKTTVWESTDVV